MWNNTNENRQLLADVSKEFIAEIAPEELEYVDELLAEYHENPPQVSSGSDDPLGFGGDIMVAVTPVIAMALSAVFKFLLEEVIKSAKTESAALMAQKVKAFFNPSAQKPVVKLSQEELAKIKEIAKKELRRGGMNPKKAEDASLIIVAKLTLGA